MNSPTSVKKLNLRRSEQAFQEVWAVRLADPAHNRGLWLRFTLLVTKNGFRRIAETWAVFFERDAHRELLKAALKQTYDISAYRTQQQAAPAANSLIQIGDCELTLNPAQGTTRGVIRSKGHVIQWNLRFKSSGDQPAGRFSPTPDSLVRAGILTNSATTLAENLQFEGELEYDGMASSWKSAPGMVSHSKGPRSDHSWVWSQANTFTNDHGEAAPFIFEGLTTRAHAFGTLRLPKLSSFYFCYQGQEYIFNSVWDSLRSKSVHSLVEWEFQADRGDLSFRGKATAEHKDFAGLTYEDTNGSLLYGAISKLSTLGIHVYRAGKLENSFYANGTAGFEIVSRERNPYVPLLV